MKRERNTGRKKKEDMMYMMIKHFSGIPKSNNYATGRGDDDIMMMTQLMVMKKFTISLYMFLIHND